MSRLGRPRLFVASLCGLLALPLTHGASTAEEITVAAGAGFRRPIAEVAALYEKERRPKVLQV